MVNRIRSTRPGLSTTSSTAHRRLGTDRVEAEAILRDMAFVLEMTRRAHQIDTSDLWAQDAANAEFATQPALA
jgi:hypothetical protein